MNDLMSLMVQAASHEPTDVRYLSIGPSAEVQNRWVIKENTYHAMTNTFESAVLTGAKKEKAAERDATKMAVEKALQFIGKDQNVATVKISDPDVKPERYQAVLIRLDGGVKTIGSEFVEESSILRYNGTEVQTTNKQSPGKALSRYFESAQLQAAMRAEDVAKATNGVFVAPNSFELTHKMMGKGPYIQHVQKARAVENLVKSGAFDPVAPSRKGI